MDQTLERRVIWAEAKITADKTQRRQPQILAAGGWRQITQSDNTLIE